MIEGWEGRWQWCLYIVSDSEGGIDVVGEA